MTTELSGTLNARRCTAAPCTFWTNHASGICPRCRERAGLAQPTINSPRVDSSPIVKAMKRDRSHMPTCMPMAEKKSRKGIKLDDPEHREQIALFDRIRGPDGDAFPELRQAYAIPNAAIRGKVTRIKMLAEGLKAGELDINLDLARGGFFGFRGEMKSLDGKLSVLQAARIEEHKRNGYAAEVMWGAEDAWRILTRYVQLPPTKAG